MVKPMFFILSIMCIVAFIKIALDYNEDVGKSLQDMWYKLFKVKKG